VTLTLEHRERSDRPTKLAYLTILASSADEPFRQQSAFATGLNQFLIILASPGRQIVPLAQEPLKRSREMLFSESLKTAKTYSYSLELDC
jgi:hypothetical protein